LSLSIAPISHTGEEKRMSSNTVAQFATELKLPANVLLD